MLKVKRILLIGGGSGGHIIPNLAIASVLKSKHAAVDLLYLGSRYRLDRTIVKKAGLPFCGIFAGKWRRYFSWENGLTPLWVLMGVLQSIMMIGSFWPHRVVATGGYVSLPVVIAAWLLRRRIILIESNAAMGLSNRLISTMADQIIMGFPKIYVDAKAHFVGNPVRPQIMQGQSSQGWKLSGLKKGKPVLLIMGGSLGADFINQWVVKTYPELKKITQVIHITGQGKEQMVKDESYVSFSYLDEVNLADIYAISDGVISRAGANALAEIAALKIPNIIIPLPNSAEDNQQKNAHYYGALGASMVLPQVKITAEIWLKTIKIILTDQKKRQTMQTALAKCSSHDAAYKIAQMILKY